MVLVLLLVVYLIWFLPTTDTFALNGLQPVAVDLDRYVGTWYEQYRMSNWFEGGLNNVTATYALREKGVLGVVNSGYTPKNRLVAATATATPTKIPGVYSVSFFPGATAPYVILAAEGEGKNNEYIRAVVGAPDRKNLWLLTRYQGEQPTDRAFLEGVAKKNKYPFPLTIQHTEHG